ncbi:MAG: hypothetical protein HKP61_16385 [Dactylosporangium sp.]|nr:hypothetical protein [Dactylosporangium sp.]NNJ62485.1 hypothetical protein [Dactylosporangium sp.]
MADGPNMPISGGVPVTDELIEQLTAEAEAGYDVERVDNHRAAIHEGATRASRELDGSVASAVALLAGMSPTSPGSNLNLLVSGVEVAVKPRHAKIRRDGYRAGLGGGCPV